MRKSFFIIIVLITLSGCFLGEDSTDGYKQNLKFINFVVYSGKKDIGGYEEASKIEYDSKFVKNKNYYIMFKVKNTGSEYINYANPGKIECYLNGNKVNEIEITDGITPGSDRIWWNAYIGQLSSGTNIVKIKLVTSSYLNDFKEDNELTKEIYVEN